ncbi:DUF6221 family protein [Streptomyces rimosus]|uniref:DUF6221 family protein n=1 Tax=Streptomyces rimosus TaxID=1927 RepID=UPI0004C0BCF1|nr:DUF6221 family protein [Streptomyces rimosus]
MRNSAATWETSTTFERCEQLRRTAREAADRARQMRTEAQQMRQLNAQLRAALQRRPPLTNARTRQEANPSRPPTDSPPSHPTPAAQLTALTAFVHARLNEEATAADLFHDPGCPAADAFPKDGTTGCDCRVPPRIRQDIAVRRGIAHASETAIREADPRDPGWPQSEMSALLYLKYLALPYELHGLWQEDWRP